MHHTTPRLALLLSLLLSLAACDDDATSGNADTSGPTSADTSGSTSADTSGSTSADTSGTSGTTDADTSGTTSDDTSDTSNDDAADTHTTDNTSDDTTDAADTDDDTDTTPVACEYIDLQWYIVECQESGLTYLKEFVDVEGRADDCPPYFVLYGIAHPTLAEALADGPCSDACLYTASNSVSAARCEPLQRYGYIIYRADGCADLYEFAEGLFPSVEAWEAENPCPAP